MHLSWGKPKSSITFNGEEIEIKASFNRIIDVLQVEKSTLDNKEKIKKIFSILVPNLPFHLYPNRPKLITIITNEIINIGGYGAVNQQNEEIIDFSYDEGAIFSSFQCAYGINLYDEVDRLHWRDFVFLFRGLPETTHIMQIMSIRGQKVPQATKYNTEERQNILTMKQVYKLPSLNNNNSQKTYNSIFENCLIFCENNQF